MSKAYWITHGNEIIEGKYKARNYCIRNSVDLVDIVYVDNSNPRMTFIKRPVIKDILLTAQSNDVILLPTAEGFFSSINSMMQAFKDVEAALLRLVIVGFYGVELGGRDKNAMMVRATMDVAAKLERSFKEHVRETNNSLQLKEMERSHRPRMGYMWIVGGVPRQIPCPETIEIAQRLYAAHMKGMSLTKLAEQCKEQKLTRPVTIKKTVKQEDKNYYQIVYYDDPIDTLEKVKKIVSLIRRV